MKRERSQSVGSEVNQVTCHKRDQKYIQCTDKFQLLPPQCRLEIPRPNGVGTSAPETPNSEHTNLPNPPSCRATSIEVEKGKPVTSKQGVVLKIAESLLALKISRAFEFLPEWEPRM